MDISVRIKKTFASQGRRFVLDAAFESSEQFVVLFGPSGSGKTVTVRSIAGLLTPDAGKIVVNGRVLFDSATCIHVPARHRNVGYVFQDYALFPHLNVFENVAFGLRANGGLRRLSRKDRLRVEEFLDIFEIRQTARSLPRELSGGQQQRVALARALIRSPDLLLLDEPFAALDHFLKDKLRNNLLEIQSLFSVPVVIITHDPDDIDAFAETLIVYESGRVRCAWPFFKKREDRQPLGQVLAALTPPLT